MPAVVPSLGFAPRLQKCVEVGPLEAEAATVPQLHGRNDLLPRPAAHRFAMDLEIRGGFFGGQPLVSLIHIQNHIRLRYNVLSVEEVMRAVIYSRVSTDAQEQDGTSLDTQERASLAFARERGWIIVDTVRDTASGTVSTGPGWSGCAD